MENLIVELSKYIIIILVTIYTLYCFTAFRGNDKKRKNRVFRAQSLIMYFIHFICYMLIFMDSNNIKVLILYLVEVVFFIGAHLLYRVIYRNLSRLVFNNMLMLLMFSFVMLTRLSFDQAVKQFTYAAVSMGICLFIPMIIDRFRFLDKFGWIYGGTGLLLLVIVKKFGTMNYGATNWIKIGSIAIQPSEFVKILFVFAIAALLSKSIEFKDIIKVTILAAAHVLVLVLERDLGGALIFFVTYLVMLFVATANPFYFIGGLLSGSFASVVAYRLFNHVRVRVMAWKNPWKLIDNQGYQVTQSLFAIGTGGWFGMGLGRGLPGDIPVVESDFIFSAISEELGGITALCIILICISCYIMFVNIAMKIKKRFYKYVALGLGTIYVFQVFLTIGGVTKFIPSTGVTLPLISAGGSSILSTIIIFGIIQGLYVHNQNEDVKNVRD
ncbi:FtsW/RodA/SpoVE family cell cycle protein [Anaeromicropila herbilytica]|uniref:Cell division protein FtsW n=1 Tax=Anaeromicropila herbilytica TaxID=2785025 RepID=A0A7R7IDY4_9FIRM|nr:FtsW/RodA/SpoVE family cell cycle protein [Anaeromicropila herbilytica]BCN30503.1 cell division protein FtsW [Anaeromicropila herbilytica]